MWLDRVCPLSDGPHQGARLAAGGVEALHLELGDMSEPEKKCRVCDGVGWWWVSDGHCDVEKRWCKEPNCSARLSRRRAIR